VCWIPAQAAVQNHLLVYSNFVNLNQVSHEFKHYSGVKKVIKKPGKNGNFFFDGAPITKKIAMTQGCTKKNISEIVTLEIGVMPPMVVFRPSLDPLEAGNRATLSKKQFEKFIFWCAMASCIKVVK
jgi:hypothetical protein